MVILSRSKLIIMLSLLALLSSLQGSLYARNSGATVTASPGVSVGASYRTYLTVTNGGGKAIVGLQVWTNQPYIEFGSLGSPLGWSATLTPWGTPIMYYAVWTASTRIYSIANGASNGGFSLVVTTLGIPLSWCTLAASSGGSMKTDTCGIVTIN